MRTVLIGYCGMNCALCKAFSNIRYTCPGCKLITSDKPLSRSRCYFKMCRIIKKNKWKYCSSKCKKFPCEQLRRLHKRYRTKYEMSMIDNLMLIEKRGIRGFIESKKEKWTRGNEIYCIHTKKYHPIVKT